MELEGADGRKKGGGMDKGGFSDSPGARTQAYMSGTSGAGRKEAQRASVSEARIRKEDNILEGTQSKL